MFVEGDIVVVNLRFLEGEFFLNVFLNSIYSVFWNFLGKSYMIRYYVIRIWMWYIYNIFSDFDVFVLIYWYIDIFLVIILFVI